MSGFAGSPSRREPHDTLRDLTTSSRRDDGRHTATVDFDLPSPCATAAIHHQQTAYLCLLVGRRNDIELFQTLFIGIGSASLCPEAFVGQPYFASVFDSWQAARELDMRRGAHHSACFNGGVEVTHHPQDVNTGGTIIILDPTNDAVHHEGSSCSEPSE